MVPLCAWVRSDAPRPRFSVWVPAMVVVPDPPVVPVVLGPLTVGVWRLEGPLLAQHAVLGGGGGAAVGGTVANNTVVWREWWNVRLNTVWGRPRERSPSIIL